jgi:hypothetical protein
MGNTSCDWTKSNEQDRTCADFDKWKKKKERAYNIKLPLVLEDSLSVGSSYINDQVNYPESSERLHNLVMKQLNEKHKKIYYMLYIENLDDVAVAKKFGFKADAAKRKNPRYKQIANLKKKFYNIALKIMKDQDIL